MKRGCEGGGPDTVGEDSIDETAVGNILKVMAMSYPAYLTLKLNSELQSLIDCVRVSMSQVGVISRNDDLYFHIRGVFDQWRKKVEKR